MGAYAVRCVTGGELHDKRASYCPTHNSLLRTEYSSQQIRPRDQPGIWKFFDWLPTSGCLSVGGSPITYRSEGLSKELGLANLFISFNGFWPERGASLDTCSFKDLEAPPTVQRLIEIDSKRILVVASAGNTARAFAYISSLTGFPLALVVPQRSLHRLWIPAEERGSIFLVAVRGDYYDSISLGEQLGALDGFVPEGGTKNIARRDGMGTVMLDAVLTMGRLPDFYFQAVGSGAGGIAAWEASARLMRDGRFGNKSPVLSLAQNVPCAPLYSATHPESPTYSSCPQHMYDDVLFNRKPPYAVGGGVRDALAATNGLIYGISNDEADRAKHLFEKLEGIDILPAAAIAVAALVKASESGAVAKKDTILLNITGGGERELRKKKGVQTLKPDLTTDKADFDFQAISDQVKSELREYQ